MEAFSPEGMEFIPVSRKLTNIRYIILHLCFLPLWVGIATMAFFFYETSFFWVLTTAFVVSLGFYFWLLWLIPRQVSALSYCEGKNELYIRRGIMFRTLTVVPYGRMQFVDLEEGPLARYYGVATVKLHTASAASDAEIDGIPKEEATRLRRKLTELGESLMAGL
ncbi:PH domain-containing protein [Actinomycetaceae bacterium TAE3-ERU4]|nr:PH domain-containing protein [Actinomycetaceae bacterium TAE3-ERU4]